MGKLGSRLDRQWEWELDAEKERRWECSKAQGSVREWARPSLAPPWDARRYLRQRRKSDPACDTKDNQFARVEGQATYPIRRGEILKGEAALVE